MFFVVSNYLTYNTSNPWQKMQPCYIHTLENLVLFILKFYCDFYFLMFIARIKKNHTRDLNFSNRVPKIANLI